MGDSGGSASKRRRHHSSDDEQSQQDGISEIINMGWSSPIRTERDVSPGRDSGLNREATLPDADSESMAEADSISGKTPDQVRTEEIIGLMDMYIKKDMETLPESLRTNSAAEIPVGCFRHENLLHNPDNIAPRRGHGAAGSSPGEISRAKVLLQGDGYPWTFVFYLTGNDFKDNIYKALWFFIGLLKHASKEGPGEPRPHLQHSS
jgi:hypothetical protein